MQIFDIYMWNKEVLSNASLSQRAGTEIRIANKKVGRHFSCWMNYRRCL